MKYISFIGLWLLFLSFNLHSQNKLEVYFDFNQYEINKENEAILNSWISENTNATINRIHGYCDWVGSHSYNDTLSLKRVNSIYNYLKSHKIAIHPDYFEKGFGKNFEQSKIQSENRKVVILYETPSENNQSLSKVKSSITTLLEDAKIGDVLKIDELYFRNNSWVLLPKSKPVLEELVCIMKDNPMLKIEIQGHICCRLDGDINSLSKDRAKTVYNYLVRNKISKNRMSYIGFGTKKPLHPLPEKNVEEEEANRRVEIVIISK